ncbi:MAG: NAD(P)-binding domain-containing protein [Thermoleophilia bacterium]|nr:NAD(P)-binding domain-containing protein [Thermoleophilia bacterium]
MGRAMLAGILRGGARSVTIVDAVPAAAEAAAQATGGTVGSVADAARADLTVVAVKPKDAADVLAQLAAASPGGIVLSVIAGWDLGRLREALPDAPLVRTMPNLAVEHGAGLVALATDGLSSAQQEAIEAALTPGGSVVPLPESLFAAATALAGSGPGLVALVAEGLEDGAVAAGLTRDQARTMTAAVLAGTSVLLADGTAPTDLRHRVSSPAGTTVAGISVLERGAVRAHIADAVVAAAARAASM